MRGEDIIAGLIQEYDIKIEETSCKCQQKFGFFQS